MSKVLITGSADGLGREAAKQLVRGGHEVVLTLATRRVHNRRWPASRSGRSASRRPLLDHEHPSAGRPDQRRRRLRCDHPQRRYRLPRAHRRETEDGLEHVFQTNVLAPYLLTALAHRPARLIYLSSGLHRSGNPDLADLQWQHRRWDGYQAYSDSKLFDAVLAAAVARRWRDVVSTSVDPGWVRTKMGGPGAPGEIGPGADTQAWLATSSDPLARQSGCHFYRRRLRETHPAVTDPCVQDGLLAACYALTGQAIADSTGTAHAG